MGTPSVGTVVTVLFPFSDLTDSKVRPAIVLAESGRGDWVLCQLTSRAYGDTNAVPVEAEDFATGSLHITSYARPGKLFTASENLIVSQVGKLKDDSFRKIANTVIHLLQANIPL